MKVVLTGFFDCNGVVHHEFLPQGHTANKEYYLEVMRRLREEIRQKRNKIVEKPIVNFVCEFLAKNKTVIIPQPTYPADLAPSFQNCRHR